SSRGTTTNLEGSYELPLEPGTHRVVFQYVGYRPQVREVRVGGVPLRLDVQLAPEVVSLREVEVRAGAEDPAYEIMRRAIARRRHYRELVRSFACDVYIKGTVKILDAPETILGQEVGDLDGSLDSNRQGIVYLSESEARWFFQQPDRYREIMVSSKVSGDDQGFSFNSASDLNLNLYDEHIPFGRQVLSPLADNAFNYYRFRLEGTIVNEDGSWLYKIHMRPKRPEDPVMQGYLYIVDSLYLVQGLDAFLTGRAMNWEVFDTLYVHQVHVPVRPPEVWRVFSQNYRVRGGVFGFRFEGHFAAVYSNYAIDTTFAPGFFGNELLTVQPEANEKDLTYWDSIRPVPLTHEERVDYVRKDSIARVRRSKPYLDSLDRVNNRLEPLEILLGYTWRNSFKRRSWTYASPLASLQFSTVQGFYGNFDLSFRQNLDAQAHRWWRLNTVLNYGLSEKKLRNAWKFTYHFNQTHFARLELEGGTAVAQFNPEEPISLSQNTFFSLTFRRNHIRLFDKTFARIAYRRELANGLLLRSALEWSRRRPLPTHSGFSYFYRDSRTFADNTPDPLALPDHALDPNR
ncbi:MAG: carboxypeptidase-like regulatory domain-containing protein, partial [Bacteroidetes bacterium]